MIAFWTILPWSKMHQVQVELYTVPQQLLYLILLDFLLLNWKHIRHGGRCCNYLPHCCNFHGLPPYI